MFKIWNRLENRPEIFLSPSSNACWERLIEQGGSCDTAAQIKFLAFVVKRCWSITDTSVTLLLLINCKWAWVLPVTSKPPLMAFVIRTPPVWRARAGYTFITGFWFWFNNVSAPLNNMLSLWYLNCYLSSFPLLLLFLFFWLSNNFECVSQSFAYICIIAVVVDDNDIATVWSLCMCVGWGELCQISLVVIKIAPKYPSRLLNRLALRLAGRRSRELVQSVAVPCLEPALSGACLPTASAAALSGPHYTHWQLKEAPFSSNFRGLFFTMGDKKSPTR